MSVPGKVRVDGEEPIPLHKWWEVIDKFSRIDQLIELLVKQIDLTNNKLDRLIEIFLGFPPIIVPPPPPPSQVSIIPNNMYKVHTLDLTQARTDKELGLGVTANNIVVLKCDSSSQWRRNIKTADLEDLFVGYTIDDYRVTELYITNLAASGELKILVEWRE